MKIIDIDLLYAQLKQIIELEIRAVGIYGTVSFSHKCTFLNAAYKCVATNRYLKKEAEIVIN
jgi:hypothetical protein